MRILNREKTIAGRSLPDGSETAIVRISNSTAKSQFIRN
jgi:hypothetical protein